MRSIGQGQVIIESEGDIVVARKTVREQATALGFSITDTTRIVTTASELSRNIYQYARRGVMHWQRLELNGRVGLELVFVDQGPGISDVSRAMETGFSTGRGLGMGLPGTKRLVDEMTIQSSQGKGTVVQVRKWRRD